LALSRVAVYPVDTRGLVAPFANPAAGGPGRGPMMGSGMGSGMRFNNQVNMDQVAKQTGGKAYYNTNDFARTIADVVNTGSSYYTLAYATTNSKWNGELRRIKIAVDRQDVNLQHREGYYAYNLDKREENGIAAIEKRKGNATASQPAAATQSARLPAADLPAGAPNLGATIHNPSNGGFGEAMGLGAIPPTEIVFDARIQADSNAEKVGKGSALPPDNYLKSEWQHKPFRNYTIFFTADVHRIRLTKSADGKRHGTVEFVAVVYSPDGEQVNSLINTASFTLTTGQYREMLTSGLPAKMEVAVPMKGNFFLRLGVHDVTGGQVGALEIPVDQIKLGVAVAGMQTP
jgi:hypothetical protein